MSNEHLKPTLKTTFKFFNTKITDLNTARIHFNRSKGLAKYLNKSQKFTVDISLIDTPLGIMSFSIYILRITTNIGLLIQLFLKDKPKQSTKKKQRDLILPLLNDCLWCLVNLTQFFWLTYRKSREAGLQGMQFETMAQFIDIIILIIRYQQDKEDYELKYNQATEIERVNLEIEWRSKQLNMIRSLIASLAIAIIFALIFFSQAAISLSPIVSAIVLLSSFSRILMAMEKDRQLLEQLKLNNSNNPQIVISKEREMTKARLHDLNQVILYNVFLPLGLFLVITTPIPVSFILCLSMILVHYLINNLIDMDNSPRTPINFSPSP